MGSTFLIGLNRNDHPMLYVVWHRLYRWATWPFRKLEEACDLCDRRH